jgi:hypothetical protein
VDSVTALEGVDFPWPGTLIQRDTEGVFYVVDRDGLLKAFSSEGRLLRQIGRRGAGPGEYENL